MVLQLHFKFLKLSTVVYRSVVTRPIGRSLFFLLLLLTDLRNSLSMLLGLETLKKYKKKKSYAYSILKRCLIRMEWNEMNEDLCCVLRTWKRILGSEKIHRHIQCCHGNSNGLVIVVDNNFYGFVAPIMC